MLSRFLNRFWRLLIKIDLWLTGHWTLCGECGRFSPHECCNCKPKETRND